MFSKEWKLIALSALTVVLATACGHDKKNKGESTPYQGVWVNARAYNLLVVRGEARNPNLCARLAQIACGSGIAVTGEGLTLEAWEIRPNAQVFRYDPLPNQVQSRRDYNWVGGLAGAAFIPRTRSIGGYDDRDGGLCIAPFEMGAPLNSNLEENGLTIWRPQSSAGPRVKAHYVRPNPAELQMMYSALAGCSAGAPPPNAELIPLPPGGPQGQGPAVGPQNFEYEGRDRRPQPRQRDK